MYDHILIGIDFSDTSVDTVGWASSRFPRARFTLAHVIEPLNVPGYLQRELGGQLELMREKGLDARANLEQIAEESGIEANLVVRRGWTPEVLTTAAVESGAELIVVGAHHKRVRPGDEPGHTCASIVRKSTVPVLVWRASRTGPDKTVLAAVDLREESAPVAATAARYASFFGARLVLVHAMPGTLQAYLRAVSSAKKARDTLRSIEGRARAEALGRVPEELRDELDVQVVILRGRPVSRHILAAAEAETADLIVIGKYHAPGLPGRVLLGEITSEVIRGSNCSALTVPV